MNRTPAITLVADANQGIGWGHAMRTLAMAETLNPVANSNSISRPPVLLRWVTTNPTNIRRLKPPCPVERFKSGETSLFGHHTDALLVDYPEPDTFWINERAFRKAVVNQWQVVFLVDRPDQWIGIEGNMKVCPHFGAEEWDFGDDSVLAGPEYMPLRTCFNSMRGGRSEHLDKNRLTLPLLLYRVPESLEEQLCNADIVRLKTGGERTWWKERWQAVLTPPCTLAYEAMAAGVPVVLIPSDDEFKEAIGAAMIRQGVATSFARFLESRKRDFVDPAPGSSINHRRSEGQRRMGSFSGARFIAHHLIGMADWWANPRGDK